MKKKVKIILGAAALLCAAFVGIFMLLAPAEVQTEQAVRADLTDTFTLSGTVVPVKSSYVCAALPGRVAGIQVKTGEKVSEGEEVLLLDDAEARTDLESQIASLELQKKGVQKEGTAARAELVVSRQQLESQLSQVRLQYEQLFGAGNRAVELLEIARENFRSANIAYWRAYDKYADSHDPSECAQLGSLGSARTVAEQALLEAENNQSESTKAYYESTIASYESQLKLLDSSRSAVASGTDAAAGQLDIQIAQLKGELEKGAPTAPFAGTVWELLVKEGDPVAANQPLYRIYEDGDMEVEVALLDSQAALLKEGDAAELTLLDGTVLEAEITFLSPISTEELSALGIKENRCLAVLKPKGQALELGAGHQVDAGFCAVRKEQVLQLPISAVVTSESGTAVYKEVNGKAALCPVELGIQSSGRAEVLSGIEEGDMIILDPHDAGIKDGKRVTERAQ